MSVPATHLSPFDLEVLRLGEMSPARQGPARSHLESCAACRQEDQNLRRDRERFDSQVLDRSLPILRARWDAEHGARAQDPGAASWWGRGSALAQISRMAAPAAALAMAVLLVSRVRLDEHAGRLPTTPVAGLPSVTAKGGAGRPTFAAVAQQDKRVFAVVTGAALRPGDRLRFVLDPGPHRFALIASVDGAGRTSIYYPFGGTASAAVTPHQRLEIPGSIVLDDAPGPERVYALYSDRPLTATAVEQELRLVGQAGAAAIRQRETITVTAGDAQRSLLLEKESR